MLFLGFDSSTQSLSALVIDTQSRRVTAQTSLNFDRDLPWYGTRNGVLPPGEDPTVVHSPPRMWAEALDCVLANLAQETDLSRISAIAGSAQQHGSVYLRAQANERLGRLDAARPLAGQLEGLFSRETSPIWQDSSTRRECNEIREALGGTAKIAALTGSDAFERFTGPQIRKFSRDQPAAWEETHQVTLVSSFLASLLLGRLAPLDPGDAAGMNLMHLAEKRWSKRALDATAPDLERRLPEIQASDVPLGHPSPYFVNRHGLTSNTVLLPWSGDNPCSLVGLGIVAAGRVGISLGTSDTYFAHLDHPVSDERGEGHVFGSPTGAWMTLNCFQNGSLAREHVRDVYGLDWAGFSEALRSSPPGNNGHLLLPWFGPEIVPRVPGGGAWRSPNLLPEDATANCRAVVEAQMMAMRHHSQWMGTRPQSLSVTGGASGNAEILQVAADVFDCDVWRCDVDNGAALGAALRAAHGFYKSRGEERPWTEVVAGFTDPLEMSRTTSRPEYAMIYEGLIQRYAAFEAEHL